MKARGEIVSPASFFFPGLFKFPLFLYLYVYNPEVYAARLYGGIQIELVNIKVCDGNTAALYQDNTGGTKWATNQ
jgi:hypothetical protein